MNLYGTYTSVVMSLSVAVLAIAAGVSKKHLVWKRPKPLPVRRRRRPKD